MEIETLIGLGLGSCGLAAAYFLAKRKTNPIEVLDISYDKATNTVHVEVMNSSKKLFCINEAQVR